MNKVFTKEYTFNAKGIAIIIMCIHHLFSANIHLTAITKVCVAMFTILSGYGINESYNKQDKKYMEFVWIHIKKLMINYWYVFVPMTLLSMFCYVVPNALINIYGIGIRGIINFFLDFFGIRAFLYTPSLNNTWWYMEAILCCYILFPVIQKGIKRRTILTLLILMLPNIMAIWNENLLITTDRDIFYLLPFAIGILCSEKDIFNKLVRLCLNKKYVYILTSIIILFLSLIAATKVKLIGNIFYALSIICLSIWLLTNLKSMCKILIILGKHSMNIFLSHSFIYFYLNPGRKMMSICKIPIVKLVVLIVVSLIVSVIIEKIKETINKKKEKVKEQVVIENKKYCKIKTSKV